jgi:hypothetical protein
MFRNPSPRSEFARPENVSGNGGTVHPGAIAAVPVGEDIAIGLLPDLGVPPGDRGIIDDHIIVLVTAERDRLAAHREAGAVQVTLEPNDRNSQGAIPSRRPSLMRKLTHKISSPPTLVHADPRAHDQNEINRTALPNIE